MAHHARQMNSMAARSDSMTRLSQVIILPCILLAGMLNLAFPFSGDQALFTIGAQALSRGAVLYRDFWDLKQPGIYWFYHVAGALFGYNEMGIHVAELVWFTALAVIISVSMRSRFQIAWMSDLCAVFTVGVYFSVCATWHLTQLEGLAALPLFLSLLLVFPAEGRVSSTRFFIFGMLAASVALFKLMLLAIPLTFVVIAIAFRKRLLQNVFIALLGVLTVMTPVVIYFGVQHQLPLICKTYFVYPPRIVSQLPMSGMSVLDSKHYLVSAVRRLHFCRWH